MSENFGFGNFDYEHAVEEPVGDDLAAKIEQYVRDNPLLSRRELAHRFKTTPGKVAGALRNAEGPPAAAVKVPRTNRAGEKYWVYGWVFPEHLDEYSQYVTEWFGQILGSITNLAAYVTAIRGYAADPHVYLDGSMGHKLTRAANGIHRLDDLRFEINQIERAQVADDHDNGESWETLL